MCYSYEFKRKCVEMYHQGLYPDTPDGLDTKCFRDKVREWVRIEDHKYVSRILGTYHFENCFFTHSRPHGTPRRLFFIMFFISGTA